ncbi:MAG TPA: hypothetical protein VE132_14440, partial [Micromonosporaceae bacterium]|nr:hypothetical protein [Micromonosporaceae bacterium]
MLNVMKPTRVASAVAPAAGRSGRLCRRGAAVAADRDEREYPGNDQGEKYRDRRRHRRQEQQAEEKDAKRQDRGKQRLLTRPS